MPAGAGIGSDIEIHGRGSGRPGNAGGHNWTLGCIALSDADIDLIFPHIENGSPITIVRYGTRRLSLFSGGEHGHVRNSDEEHR